jgi:hypothetical protein
VAASGQAVEQVVAALAGFAAEEEEDTEIEESGWGTWGTEKARAGWVCVY